MPKMGDSRRKKIQARQRKLANTRSREAKIAKREKRRSKAAAG